MIFTLENFGVGHYCLVRTFSAGVFVGYLESREGKELILRDAIRIWYWSGAATLSQLAMEGTADPKNCLFAVPVSYILLTEVVEVIIVSDEAKKSIQGVKSWRAKP